MNRGLVRHEDRRRRDCRRFGLCGADSRPDARSADGKIAVVAAENFYGDIARQIGGDRVAVVSIMNNPDQDPHLFETTPGIVRQIAGAQLAIVNGADYDPWMEKLLAAAPQPNRKVIIAADLDAQKVRRQSASLVRPRHHAGGRQGDRRSAQRRRCRARQGLRGAACGVSRLAQTARRQDRRHPRQICRRRRHRQRAGVRLHGASARLENAQRVIPAFDHERYRAERARRRQPSSRT